MILSRYSSDQQEERRIRRWRTGQGSDPRWSQRQFHGYQYAQVPEVIGGMVAAQEANGVKWSAVATGVLTGVSVWLATRLLDRMFGIEKKRGA